MEKTLEMIRKNDIKKSKIPQKPSLHMQDYTRGVNPPALSEKSAYTM